MKIHSPQPLGFRTPDGGRYGYTDLPEFPYGEVVFIFRNIIGLLKLRSQSHWKIKLPYVRKHFKAPPTDEVPIGYLMKYFAWAASQIIAGKKWDDIGAEGRDINHTQPDTGALPRAVAFVEHTFVMKASGGILRAHRGKWAVTERARKQLTLSTCRPSPAQAMMAKERPEQEARAQLCEVSQLQLMQRGMRHSGDVFQRPSCGKDRTCP